MFFKYNTFDWILDRWNETNFVATIEIDIAENEK